MSVLRSRLAASRAAACLLVAVAACIPSFATTGSDLLVGTARDTIGNLLEGVEVLVASGGTTMRPVAVAYSDRTGRFSIDKLRPGLYKIAALKAGYLTFVGQVDTQLQNWIDLTLQPALATGGGDPIPMTRAWPLRLPKRGILRETEQQVDSVDSEEPLAPSEAASSSPDAFSIQVDQLYAVRTSMESGADERRSMHGPETRLKLASALGEGGNLRVAGTHASLDGQGAEEHGVSPASRDASSLSMALDYDAGLDDRLSFNAYFDERDLEWSMPFAAMRQAQRSWGYDAQWSRQLDAASRIELRLQHRDSRMELPIDLPADLFDRNPVVPAGDSIDNRSVAAEGSYEIVPASSHQLEVGFSARYLDGSGKPLPTHRGEAWQRGAVLPVSYMLGVEAQDTWHLSGPFSLLYGLGYEHAIAESDTSLVVPRLGGAWNLRGMALRFLVSYHAVSGGGASPAVPGVVSFRPERPVGYDTEIQVPITGRLTLAAAASYAPIQLRASDADGLPLHDEIDPTFLTDGNTAVTHNRLSLVRRSTAVDTYVEIGNGRASGTLSALLPYDLPMDDLTRRNLEFENGRIGVRVHGSGTHLNLQYRRVQEWSEGLVFMPRGSTQQLIELGLIQDLLRRQGLGSWRLLMALQVASLESEDEEKRPAEEGRNPLEAPSGQLRAGLSVVF